MKVNQRNRWGFSNINNKEYMEDGGHKQQILLHEFPYLDLLHIIYGGQEII
jgi:hypothetical protein